MSGEKLFAEIELRYVDGTRKRLQPDDLDAPACMSELEYHGRRFTFRTEIVIKDFRQPGLIWQTLVYCEALLLQQARALVIERGRNGFASRRGRRCAIGERGRHANDVGMVADEAEGSRPASARDSLTASRATRARRGRS
jgi:hypothetical protein